MKKFFSSFIFYFASLLIIYIPFQKLFSNIIDSHSLISQDVLFFVVHWYEPVLIILLAVLFILYVRPKNLLLTDLIALGLLTMGLLGIVLPHAVDLGRGIEGFRFTLFGVLVFLFARFSRITDKSKVHLLNIYLLLSIMIASWGLIEKFLPFKYWSLYGIISPDVAFGYGWHSTGSVMQVSSVMGGPNQLASYLLPAFFILFVKSVNFYHIQKRSDACLNALLFSIVGAAICLSFSRSAAIGLIVTLVALVVFLTQNKWHKIIAIILFCISVLGAIFLFNQGNEFFTHGQSQIGHNEAFKMSIEEIKNRPLQKIIMGGGLGTAGPIAIKYGNGIISESWYLQLIMELGIIGLSFWLVFILTAILKLFKNNQFGLALGITAVSITALFLHSFADNPAMTITIFLLMGLVFSSDSDPRRSLIN